jgi:hypothetical protein
MSARDLLLNQRALAATLARYERDKKNLHNRARWTSATRYTGADSTLQVTTTQWDGTQLSGSPSWETLLTLELSTGVWLVLGRVNLTPTSGSGYIVSGGIKVADGTETWETAAYNDQFTLDFNLTTHTVVRQTGVGSVTLEICSQNELWTTLPAWCDSTVTTRSLMAYPL